MLKYRLYQNKNSKSKCYGKYYARAAHEETYDLVKLSEHMANHNSPFSKGTIYGVLKDMVACVNELCLDSKKVKLDGLAIFSLGLKSTGTVTPDQFNAGKNITSAHVNALGIGEFSKRQLDLTVKYGEMALYGGGQGD